MNSRFNSLELPGAEDGYPVAEAVFGNRGDGIHIGHAILRHPVSHPRKHLRRGSADTDGDRRYNEGADVVCFISR
jgi:hypothetical protein